MTFEMPIASEFMADLTARNADILSALEQSALQASRIVIAGCGTVGGSVVEPLVRLGLSDFVLADPDVFDTTNLNRQACNVDEIGSPKATVLQDHIMRINPLATVAVFNEGLTIDNLGDALTGASVVFDGVDAFTSLWVKYLIHAHSARYRIPVITGSDYGGKPTLYVFDYRRDPRPFYGKARESDFRENNHERALRWLGVRNLPTDFLPVIGDRMTTGAPWPQISYCSLGMGATGSRAVIDLVLGRKIPRVVAMDIHMLMRSRRERWREAARRPRVIVATQMQLRRGRNSDAPVDTEVRKNGGAPVLQPVIEAIRHAPSMFNAQPWRIKALHDTLRIECESGALPEIDEFSSQTLLQSFGCAYAAAEAVADIDVSMIGDVEALTKGGCVAEVHVKRIRDEYPRAMGALQLRQTNRQMFDLAPLDCKLLQSFGDIAASHGGGLEVLDDWHKIRRVAGDIRSGLRERMKDDAYIAETLRWTQSSPRATGVGMNLGCGKVSATAIRAARASAMARVTVRHLGLTLMLVDKVAGNVEHCGALLLLTGGDEGKGEINAGRTMMEIWLATTRANIAFQPLSLTNIGEARRKRVAETFGITDARRGRVILRVGHARRGPESPRLPVETIVRESHGRQ